MSNIFNDPLWPNGMQTDDEGYAVFYPLGTNKIPLPTIASDWPEGSKLIFPFVYDENDKLVDFCDTKAMEIDNNNTIIDMPYTDIKADFSSIIEGTLTINTPSDSNVEIKWGSVDKVLTEKIEKVLGKGNCKVSFNKDTNKAIVAVGLDTTESQMQDVQTLLDRVLPSNLITEMEWADGLPMTYTRLEYLENTERGKCIYFDLPFTFDDKTTIEYATNYPQVTSGTQYPRPFGGASTNEGHIYNGNTIMAAWHATQYVTATNITQSTWAANTTLGNVTITRGIQNTVILENGKITLNGQSRTSTKITSAVSFIAPYELWGWGRDGGSFIGRFYSFKHERNGQLIVNLVPALDNTTGTPCMFDTVTKTPLWNQGTGDFTYAGKEGESTTYSLRNRMYAQMTEHGIRRLYRVPEGYSSKEEYAAENGFKELIELPMPEEGYWVPEWRETETQLICDWVETEPPVEEIQ